MAIKRDRTLLWLSLPMILCIASILLIAVFSHANTTTYNITDLTPDQAINEIDELGPTLTTIHIAELHDPKQNVSVIGIAGEQYAQNETIRTPPVLILVTANGTVLNTTQAPYPIVVNQEEKVEKNQLDSPPPHPIVDPAGFVSSGKKEAHTKQYEEVAQFEEEESPQQQQQQEQQIKPQQDRILVSRYLHGTREDENGESSHDPRIGNRVIIFSIILFLIAGFFAVYWVTRSAQQEELRKHYQEFKVIQQHSARLSGLASPRTPHAHGMGSSRQHSQNHPVYGDSYQNRSLDDEEEDFMLDLSPQATGVDDDDQQHHKNNIINNNKNLNKPGGTNYQTFE